MDDIKDFFWAIASDWLSLMTGIGSVILAGIALLAGANNTMLWWLAAYVTLFVAAYRVWSIERQRPGPQIVAIYETPNRKEPDQMSPREYAQWRNQAASSGSTLAEREKPLILKNLSDIPAINVEIRDSKIAQFTATFPIVPRITKDEPASVQTTIEGTGRDLAHHLGVLLEANLEQATSLNKVTEGIALPLMIHYQDMHGREFETQCEIQYSHYHHMTVIKRYGRIGQRPRWLGRRT